MNLSRLSFSQLVNASLAVFLLLGIAATTYSVSSLRSYESEAKGKPGTSTASIVLNQTDPHLGDLISFTSSGGSRISVACYQGGVGNMVYSADQAVGTEFLLGGSSSLWLTQGGDALCYAWLYNRTLSKGSLAAVSFTALAAR